MNQSLRIHFDLSLNKTKTFLKSILFEDIKTKYKYISNIVGTKSNEDCYQHFRYCKQILLDRIKADEKYIYTIVAGNSDLYAEFEKFNISLIFSKLIP